MCVFVGLWFGVGFFGGGAFGGGALSARARGMNILVWASFDIFARGPSQVDAIFLSSFFQAFATCTNVTKKRAKVAVCIFLLFAMLRPIVLA